VEKGTLMLTQNRVLDIYRFSGALLEGHFKLNSGYHADKFLQSAAVLQYPEYTTALCGEIAAQIKVQPIDAVIGPAFCGILVAYEVAKALETKAIFGEIRYGNISFRPKFNIREEDRVVVVDDVLTTGESISKIIELIHDEGARVVATGFIIDCSDGVDFGIPKVALAKIKYNRYLPFECPMCRDGSIPVEPF